MNTGNKKSTGLRFMCVAQSAVEPYVPVVWPSEGQYVNPTTGTQSAWGWRKFDNKAIEFHGGVDIRDDPNPIRGKAVRAVADGKAYVMNYRESGYGYHVIVEHDIPGKGKYSSLYAHMQSDGLIADGAEVKAGDQIGKVGNTGNTTKDDYGNGGDHLHFEFWRGGQNDGKTAWINPTNLYAHRDTRTTSTNPEPLFKKTGATYAYNPSFDWNYNSNPLPERYSHSTAYQN